MVNLIFACMAIPGNTEGEALLLARSLRAFGGGLAASPFYVLVPAASGVLSTETSRELRSLDVTAIPFTFAPDAVSFPFADKVQAAAAAEAAAEKESRLLVWMDSDSLVLQEPAQLLLSDDKVLGCRPVDLSLIGSNFELPPDAFWALIYEHCHVPVETLIPVITSVDRRVIRPYYNAGLLVVRPRHGLLRLWRDIFVRLIDEPAYDIFCRQGPLYRLFMHQAALAGAVLSTLAHEDIVELPWLVNYPLHLHTRYPVAQRPARLNDAITCRYDTFFGEDDWRQAIDVEEPLRSWLDQAVAPAPTAPHSREGAPPPGSATGSRN